MHVPEYNMMFLNLRMPYSSVLTAPVSRMELIGPVRILPTPLSQANAEKVIRTTDGEGERVVPYSKRSISRERKCGKLGVI